MSFEFGFLGQLTRFGLCAICGNGGPGGLLLLAAGYFGDVFIGCVAAATCSIWWHGSCLFDLYEKVGAALPAGAPLCELVCELSSSIEWHVAFCKFQEAYGTWHLCVIYSPSEMPVEVLASSARAPSLTTASTNKNNGEERVKCVAKTNDKLSSTALACGKCQVESGKWRMLTRPLPIDCHWFRLPWPAAKMNMPKSFLKSN